MPHDHHRAVARTCADGEESARRLKALDDGAETLDRFGSVAATTETSRQRDCHSAAPHSTKSAAALMEMERERLQNDSLAIETFNSIAHLPGHFLYVLS